MRFLLFISIAILGVSCRVNQVVDIMHDKSALITQMDLTGRSMFEVANNGPDTAKAGTIYDSPLIKNLQRFVKKSTYKIELLDSLGNFMPFVKPGFIYYKFIDDETFEVIIHSSKYEELKLDKKAARGVTILFEQKILNVSSTNEKLFKHYKIDNFVRIRLQKIDKYVGEEVITIKLQGK
ncbi:MAG: hypothetical protein CMD20_03535 [Flavobacteriales bacterium]|nr:hypothetical protein [Flavobacteriales bacterium]